MKTEKRPCPECQEETTMIIIDGQPDPRQVPHCYRCAICETIKRTNGAQRKIRPFREGGGWFFICHDCKSNGFDS